LHVSWNFKFNSCFNSLVIVGIAIFLWIFTIAMFRILSKGEEKFKGKLIYFFNLKFTRLTVVSNVFFVILVFIIFSFSVSVVFTGLISHYVDYLIEILICFSLVVQNSIIFIGMTNWRKFIQCYSCGKFGKIIEDE
jgi:hypothetical protein